MHDEQFTGSVSPSSDVLVQRLPDGEAIFLNLATEEYFGLDSVGAAMYSALVGCGSTDEAYARVLNEFDVDPERLRRDFLALIDKLVSRQIVEYHDS